MENLDFTGKVALITGVSRTGLGFAYAETLASMGCKIVVNDYGVDWEGAKSANATDEVVVALRELGAVVHGIAGNVVTDYKKIVDEVVATFGGLDIVINNAGSGGNFDTQIDVHLIGSNRITEAAWPHLQKSGHGRIVNISSSGSFGAPAMPGYAAAKGAMISLTRTQAILGMPHGIISNVIQPSAWTPSTAGIDVEGFPGFMSKYMPTQKVADFVSFLCHEKNTTTGETFSVGGGLVTRIVFAETDGAIAQTDNPAEWEILMPQVTDPKNLSVVTTMWGHLTDFAAKLSPEASEHFSSLGINTVTPGKLSTK